MKPDFAPQLETAVRRLVSGVSGISNLNRLSGGASQETWSFDATGDKGIRALILRRSPGGTSTPRSSAAVGLPMEARVIRLVESIGVPVPPVVCVFDDSDGVGSGYVMERIEGETIARKILRDAQYASARTRMAGQCGSILARIHRVSRDAIPDLAVAGPREQFEQYRSIYDSYGHPHPVFEVAFKWLETHMPEGQDVRLVHGDFRNGNLMISSDGVKAVLDWELTHFGDPAEDLGWICVNSWRFGESLKVVGGFGSLGELLEGYTQAGGTGMTPERVKFWEIFGTLKWGIMCMGMYQAFAQSSDRSVERAAIGRRSSETEIDLLNLLYATDTLS
jgi:aminoglycoside phosphotransferase (APT) family kinase protein